MVLFEQERAGDGEEQAGLGGSTCHFHYRMNGPEKSLVLGKGVGGVERLGM
jgi:hypothetical protein